MWYTYVENMNENTNKAFPKANSFGPPLIGDDPRPFTHTFVPEIINVHEDRRDVVEITKESFPNETKCTSDGLTPYQRRVVIAVNAYGMHNLSQAASFVGNLSAKELRELVEKDENIKNALQNGEVPCFTKAELVSRLCVEAETANKASDKINAITKLMEFRGLAAPEGGSRNFSRTVMRFKKA